YRWACSSSCVSFHSLIEGLDVRAAEPAGSPPLHKLEEHSVSLIWRTGEQLKQVAPFIAICKYVRRPQALYLSSYIRQPVGEHVVICGRRTQEIDPVLVIVVYGGRDVIHQKRQMLHTWPTIPGKKGFYLASLFSQILLEDGEGYAARRAPDDNGVHPLIAHLDVFTGIPGKPESAGVEISGVRQRPALHADRDVIEQLNPSRRPHRSTGNRYPGTLSRHPAASPSRADSN